MTGRHDAWYSPADLPDGRLHVRVWWMAHGLPREIDAVRMWLPRERRFRWHTLSARGAIVALPPNGMEGDAWGEAPVCWQPLDASAWTWPREAPEPMPVHAVPRMREIGRQRFAEVEAVAGEVASHRHEIDDDLPWWRDATAIRYEPAGSVSEIMAEGRLMRALAHCGALNPRLHTATTATLLATLADHADATARVAAAEFARFRPLPQDLEDFGTAMAWFAALYPPGSRGPAWRPWSLNRQQRVLHYRALDRPLSYADIAHELSPAEARRRGRVRTAEWARQIYVSGVSMVHRIANMGVVGNGYGDVGAAIRRAGGGRDPVDGDATIRT